MIKSNSVTVAVLTYRPDKRKLLATLRSVLRQKNIDFQIVVADDGSEDPLTQVVQDLFHQHAFENYELVQSPENRGTVYNTLRAVTAASGVYTKLISPGDMLADENALQKWVESIKSSDSVVSCCEVVCYQSDGNRICPIEYPCYPQDIQCYLSGDVQKARYNYLVFDDIFMGAATLCHTKTLLKYLEEIAGRIVFGEDNVYRLMAYDGLTMSYHSEAAVVYEVGAGVSTSSSSVWNQRLQKDWDACKELIFQRPLKEGDAVAINFRRKHSGKGNSKLKLFRVKGLLIWRLRQRLAVRKTRKYFPEGLAENVVDLKGR